ncbi:thiamine biosynthesis protein ThiC [Streptomyces kaniharaensis]|nr:thiamine biosynthesis protein ThiC [Streptomyces kaniharaensis]
MKISQKIRDEHGDGSTAVNTDYDAEGVAGMQAMSEGFRAQGNWVYLPLADRHRDAVGGRTG